MLKEVAFYEFIKVKQALHQIWMAPTREDAYKSFDAVLRVYSDKYPKATGCLEKDKKELLAFYDYPTAHWQHIRTSNPIESTFGSKAYVNRKPHFPGNAFGTDFSMACKFNSL
ncbi:MAG: hypothetical protein D3924_11340 [Candidatus Electrothrix sp. AR4]|nr:hypothetical protein [Candidatus Electrothrix sp. AR4]